MKAKLIIVSFFIVILFGQESFAQKDCPSLTISIGKHILTNYDISISKYDIITITIENTRNRFKISKVKLKIVSSNSEISVRGLTTKFSDIPILEIPVERLLSEYGDIEKISISILEIIDESTNSPSDCFYYGQEYIFWLQE